MQSPTTPIFLSEPEAPPPTKPVVYSPVPTFHEVSYDRWHYLRERLTIKTFRGFILADEGLQLLRDNPYFYNL